MSAVWISDGGSRPEKIPFIQLSHTSKIFVAYDRSDSPDNMSTS